MFRSQRVEVIAAYADFFSETVLSRRLFSLVGFFLLPGGWTCPIFFLVRPCVGSLNPQTRSKSLFFNFFFFVALPFPITQIALLIFFCLFKRQLLFYWVHTAGPSGLPKRPI